MEDISFEIKIKNTKIKLFLTVSDDLFEITRKIRVKHKRKKLLVAKKEADGWNGCVINTFKENNLVYIIIKRDSGTVDISTLTHEIFHATGSILRKMDINYYEDEESYAYLNGELNSFVISKLIEFNEKISYNKHKDIKIKCVRIF